MLGQLRQSPVPTTATCTDAQTSILQMDSVFQSLSPDIQAKFQSAHDTIMQSYNAQWYDALTWIPLTCATTSLYALGVQADGLTAQMQSAAGQVPVGVGGPATGAYQSLLPSLLGGQSTAVLVIGVLVVG